MLGFDLFTFKSKIGMKSRAAYVRLLYAFCMFVQLGMSLAYDVYISQASRVGSIVFNASLDSGGWRYKLNVHLSGRVALDLLSVDQTLGHVLVRKSPYCIAISHNPFKAYVDANLIESESRTGFVQIPLRVFIRGENCYVKYRRKTNSNRHYVNTSYDKHRHNSIDISTQLTAEASRKCLAKNFLIMNVSSFLPAGILNCHLHFESMQIPGHIYLDNKLGQIRTAGHVCQNWPQILFIKVKTKCKRLVDSNSYTLKITINARMDLNISGATSDIYKLKFLGIKNGRSKRGTTNTPPSFAKTQFEKHVREEQGAGLVIDTITAFDPDSGNAGILTYTLVPDRDGRSQNMFAIGSSSGQLTTTQRLDRENIQVHYFKITATDNGSPPETTTASLIIYVDDINDHAPRFEKSSYSRDVPESLSIGESILTVRANDEDSGPNGEIEYRIVNPSGDNEAFHIDTASGSITTKQKLDREKIAFYKLIILAQDRARIGDRKSSTTTVEVTVLDENDNKPQFTRSSYTVDVSEDIDPSRKPVIADIKATDADAGQNAVVRYSITGGNERNTFAIDSMTGKLSVARALDYEQQTSYRLNIIAHDSGDPPRSNSTTVLVRVIDVNDNSPQFYASVYQESVLEDVPVGYNIMRVQAYDADAGKNSALVYTVKEAPANLPIIIDSSTGSLTTSRRLDRETEPRYTFKVEAKDQGKPPRSATANVEITVRDVNDNPPIFTPRSYDATVSEEAPRGTPVITVTATDADEGENSRVTYKISSGNTRGAFEIYSQMGQGLIRVARPLDYKEQSKYILSVTAADRSNHVDTATVTINISDANTFRPVFQGTPYYIMVDEDAPVGSTVFKVMARDDDDGENARIVYTIVDNNAFSIDAVTGDIKVKKGLDRETTSGYLISVTATDHGQPRKSDTTDVEIVVRDVNDNPPKFLKTVYNGQVAEDAVIGTSILTISANDSDQGMNGRVRYTFEDGNSGGGDFRIDPILGILRTAKQLDRERVGSYELKAFAHDRGTPERSTSVIINIEVDDVNDNAPQFPSSDIHLYIQENSPIGSTVDQILAVDPDIGLNSEVEYIKMDGLDSDSFALETRPKEMKGPAVITTLIELDYEGGKKEYSLVIRARSFHLFSDATITIHVQDVNDNEPQLEDFMIIFNNFKNHFPTGSIGKIPAHDPDVNDELRYKFISGNQAKILDLDPDTGLVKMDSRLNSDVPTNGTLQVSVTDGINEVRATCRLYVRLVTDDMLHNSITVRLNAIDQTAFLSPLYDLFVNALASIVPTTVENIFIFNIRDDTDVSSKILNVSFSVRQKLERNSDVFYTPLFLRERVYLQRTQLAKLSTLEVLPFDDNLCVREPCLNFEKCLSILKFGNVSDFITSDRILFRSIQPINGFSCQCPAGFTGMTHEYLCDTEVNLCYSSPCGQNGSCLQHEGGYTCKCKDGFAGDNCDIDMRHHKYDSCLPGVCKSSARCSPLIRGGFRCERCSEPKSPDSFCRECSEIEDHTQFCELRTRSFPRGSFLMFPSLKKRHRFKIRLMFASRERNALLFYNGRYNEKHDFVALEIVDGQVEFSFSLGTNVTRVRATVDGGVNDGQWHEVTVAYHNRTATLTVGEWCDTEISIQYGKKIGNYTCAARGTQVLEKRCEDVTETCHRFLDLTGPFQLGGLPTLHTDFQVRNTDYQGCIRDLHIDDKFIDLNDFVWNNNTEEGCKKKQSHCKSGPCKNTGTCYEGWGVYKCECKEGFGGKDCTQKIQQRRHLNGTSYLAYNRVGLPIIRLPWYNALSFRTRQSTGLLMSIDIATTSSRPVTDKINIELVKGYLHYIHPEKTVVLESLKLNDGKWHYLETRWLTGKLQITLDYGQIQQIQDIGDWVVGKKVSRVLVGGVFQKIGSTTIVMNGFKGCVENVRVGNNDMSQLTNPSLYNVKDGCGVADPCDKFPCPANSYCTNDWERHTCTCEQGRVGPKCESVCEKFKPCRAGSTCLQTASSSDGYVCECNENHSGQYCEIEMARSCPASWWGKPVCGPCNCATNKGFNFSCDKDTGTCLCKKDHYKPVDSDECFPCECYSIGSYNSTCDSVSGQCYCKPGVTGRKCDACYNKFAEVTRRGCEFIYDSCPRSFGGGIWWQQTLLDKSSIQKCPKGTVGIATRICDKDEGWLEPDMFNCTTEIFESSLKPDVERLEQGQLKMNTYMSKSLMQRLEDSGNKTRYLYGMDIFISFRVIKHVLQYENQQDGLNLTHTQDRSFIQNIVNCLGRTLSPQYNHTWQTIDRRFQGRVIDLMEQLEEYTNTLAQNMQQLFTQPFDIAHDNLVLGLDYISLENRTQASIPKFNNKVQNPDMFDKDTHIALLASALPSTVRPKREIANKNSKFRNRFLNYLFNDTKPLYIAERGNSQVVVSYVMYKHLGNILPNNYDKTVRIISGVPVVVNSPVFTVNLVMGNKSIHSLKTGPLGTAPLNLTFKQLEVIARTGPQCVYWRKDGGHDRKGAWSREGCTVARRIEDNGDKLVTCQCDHLSTFALLMDVSSLEYGDMQTIELEVVTYIGLVLSLLTLLACFALLCCLHGLHCNSVSIHINLVFTIFCAHFIFLVGIDKTYASTGCTVVAILLHYFVLCNFAWMFVEGLHIYRRLTEVRNVNQGSMKFYYVIGYVIPGIIVGLAVGLSTASYSGENSFCWMQINAVLFWSFAAPILVVILCTVVVFGLAINATCQAKHADPDFNSIRHSLWASLVLLPLLGLSWAFAWLALIYTTMVFFQYLFALVVVTQAVFFLLTHIIFNKSARNELKYRVSKIQGKQGLDDSLSATRTTMLSRSALAYHHNNSSLEGGLNRIHVGISTTSTTSQSTSKGSMGLYPHGIPGYNHSSSTSTNANIPSASEFPRNAGIPPYGYEASIFHQKTLGDPDTGEKTRKRRDSDTDSELSAMEHPDMDLASSHSSDDDEDYNYAWGKSSKKVAQGTTQGARMDAPPPTPPEPVHSTPSLPPAYSNLFPKGSKWSEKGYTNNAASDVEIKTPNKVKVIHRPTPEKSLYGSKDILRQKGCRSPGLPERIDSLSPKLDPGDRTSPKQRISVKVLSHNGSLSESEMHV